MADGATVHAARLMSDFAARTGVSGGEPPRRYLWTDAFAVCNFLALFERGDDPKGRERALALIDQVHRVLGRFRDDESRRGWISGLDEAAGERHPTAGGLRIGKPLHERGISEAFDDRLEWDRDGQYFHYLTKWMHALCVAAAATGETVHVRRAQELALAAFRGFARRSVSGAVTGLCWKMSTDLSRPLVAATGLHDALDGFITFREVRHALAAMGEDAAAPDLDAPIMALSALCRRGGWMTDDPLGIGGLLFDAFRLCALSSRMPDEDARLLAELLDDCGGGLSSFLASRLLERPLSQRLAFRELGLAVGLRALPAMRRTPQAASDPVLRELLERLAPWERLANEISDVWLAHAHRPDATWLAHRDINEVMLATALVPERFLSAGG
jgi:hypothetical protein